MASWQVTGRLKTGVAALAGAVVVSMVAPAVAEAASAERDTSSPSNSANRAADVQAKHKTVPSRPGPADSAAQQSSAPGQSSASAPSTGFGQAPSSQPTQRKDKPPDRGAHKFSPQQRSSANSPGSASGSGPATKVGADRPKDRDPNKVTPQPRTQAPDTDRRDRPSASTAPPQGIPGRSSANGSAMQQLQAWVPRKPKTKAKTGTHDLAYRYRVVNGRPVDPAVQLLDEDWEIWGITVWERDSYSGKFTSDILLGLGDGVTGAVDTLWKILNPTQWDELQDELEAIAAFAQEHPVEFAKQLASWDQWQTDPGRALGNNAFALIPGAGALAKMRTLRKALENSQTTKGPNADATPNPEAAQPPAAPPPAPAQKPEAVQQPAPPAPTPERGPDAPPVAPIPDRTPGDSSSTGAPERSDGQHDTTQVPPTTAPRRVDNSDRPVNTGTSGRADTAGSRKSGNRFLPPAVRQRIDAGNEFNNQMRPRYPHNEVRLGNNKVVDSYVPRKEIVERKHTQLAEVRPETAIGYLRMLSNKYPPGQQIANTAANRRTFANRPDLLGSLISGRQVLEVPVQTAPVPRTVIDEASDRGIIIRDPNGKVYNP